jgi:ribonuclease HI
VNRVRDDCYLAYADGACRGNPGPGGWGAVIVAPDGAREELNGSDAATTNNKMELTAAIEALRRIPRGAPVVLRSDSQYLVNTMNRNWKRNANRDLWEQLDIEAELREVTFEWVRGHSGDELNERADRLANFAIDGTLVHRGSRAALRAAPADSADAIDGLLRAGEAVRKCFGCGRRFVAASADEIYCSQVACQIKARRG